jgi:hypothetical protein
MGCQRLLAFPARYAFVLGRGPTPYSPLLQYLDFGRPLQLFRISMFRGTCNNNRVRILFEKSYAGISNISRGLGCVEYSGRSWKVADVE